MKKQHSCKIYFQLFLLLGLSACFRQDIRTLDVQVPQLRSEACAGFVRDAFHRVDGVEAVELMVSEHIVRVRYDARKMGIKNIEYLLTAAGFEANGQAPDPDARAKLPEGCR